MQVTVEMENVEPANGQPEPAGICYLTSVIMNAHSGTEGHLLRLVRSLDRTRFDPHLVVLQNSPFIDKWDDPHVPLRSLGYRALHSWDSIRRVLRFSDWLRDQQIRIVELHSPEAQFLGCWAARRAGVPVIVSGRRNLGYNYNWKSRLQNRITNGTVDRFLANSQVVIQRIGDIETIDRGRFDLIYNGVDLERFDRDSEKEVTDEFANACREAVMVSVAANLRPVKNLKMFLRAAHQVVEARDDVRFALLGAGPEEADLRQLVGELGISQHVLFPGAKVPVAPYLRRSAIGCLSSDSEGFSNALVEYMAAGLPVVATDVGGAREAVVEGDTGYLVAAGDYQAMARQILKLVRDPSLREKLGAHGRANVESDFNLDRQMTAYHTLYEGLLRAKSI